MSFDWRSGATASAAGALPLCHKAGFVPGPPYFMRERDDLRTSFDEAPEERATLAALGSIHRRLVPSLYSGPRGDGERAERAAA